MKYLLIIGLVFCSCKSKMQNEIPAQASEMHIKFDSLFSQLHADKMFNGNVLIASGDTVLYQASFGPADHSSDRKLNDTSVYELASVTKQFTAMGIVLLKEQGKLNYDDSLRHFFPELPYSNITVRHLLHHVSGLPDYMELVISNTKPGLIAVNADMISLLAEKKPKSLFKPGEKWEYSNTGYVLLASIIEKVSGKSFGDFLKEYIFNPLGMTHTELYRRRYEKRVVDNYALGYMSEDGGKSWALPDSLPAFSAMVIKLDGIVGDGTVNSTAPDLLKWSRALDKHVLVSKAVQDEIFTPGKLNNGEAHEYAYGWVISKTKQGSTVAIHSGGWPGYGTMIEKHLDAGKTVILLSNHDRPYIDMGKVSNILYGIKEEERKELQLEEKVLKGYEGTYQVDKEFAITISVENGKIYEQATGQGRLEIFPEKEDLFFLKAVEAQIRFVRNDKKEITGMVLLQNGQEVPGKKVK